MSQAQINEIEGAIAEILDFINAEGIDSFSDEVKDQLAQVLEQAGSRISELRESLVQQPELEELSIPEGIQLLWQLSGGQEQAFINYLRTFPLPEFQGLLANQGQLLQTIEQLRQNNPIERNQNIEGIEQAPLQSSNIWGFNYDPRQGRLLVRFQGGNVYSYDGVPPQIFNMFKSGALPARTNGRNQYGSWWRGKMPSLGATFYQMIREGGFPYQRLQ